jgi:molecular chaperone DnaK
MAMIVGIDLGTTNSLIGAVRDGSVALFGERGGGALLPSVVGAMPSGEVVVGRQARNRRLLDPEGTVSSIKRKMGEATTVRVGRRDLSPSEVSALVLSALLDRAEEETGERPPKAVITVPAYFDDVQRQATKDAGEIAGLEVERLVNEPTAAALTYETGNEELVLVYDFGGGTFDVSVLERDAGFMEVRSSHGDTRLGGDDIDRALIEEVLSRLGKGREVVVRDPRGLTRLTEAVERAKVALSSTERTGLYDPFIAGTAEDPVNLELALTREELERVARPFVERTLACIDAALREARVTPKDLNRILLVGGSSRMPLVERMVSEHLGCAAVVDDDADRAVALGAAKLAGRMAGLDIDEILVDITPHTLVVGALNPEDDERVAVPIVKRGTVIPTEREHTLYTGYEDQPAVEVPVGWGDARRWYDNVELGLVRIDDLPPSAAASPVDVTLRLDLSGVLEVSALHRPSGRSATARIDHGPTRLTRAQRDRAARTLEEMRERPEAPAALVPVAIDEKLARALLARAERAVGRDADSDAARRVREAAVALTEALRDGSATETHLETLTDALFDMA